MAQIIKPEIDITEVQKLIESGCVINAICPHTSTVLQNGYSFVIKYTVIYTPKQ